MTEPERVCSRCGEKYSSAVIFCPKDGTPLGARKTEVSDDPYLDLRVAGQFRLKQLIGVGAMGRVYRAHQAGIDRDVAMKILHRDLLRNKTVISRFHREAKVASRLVHPNVVQVLMTGELEATAPGVGGEAYLVMEFLDGISLRSALSAAGGAMPLPRALHIMLQVADAVGEGHAQGIVHRDLKPENVMLVKRGDDADFVKVLDFGVARIDWSDNSVATQAGVIFGTARYISPEGARGSPVAASGDVYSMATMLFQCLSGETPFDADNPVAILLKHATDAPPDVRSRTRSSYVPEAIARVITANLAKEPSERCRDGREFGRAVLEAARVSGLSPDNLVVRSTLLGGNGALHLASMERTKSLDLSQELAAKLASSGAGQTQLDDVSPIPGSVPNGAAPSRTAMLDPAPASARYSTPEPAYAATNPIVRASSPGFARIEPTLADEPVQRLVPSASGVTQTPSGAHYTSNPELFRGSVPSHPTDPDSAADEYPLPEHDAAWWRVLLIAACFVIGVGLTLIVAHRLGAFEKPTDNAASYADRARRALAQRAFAAPPGENVKELTDTALRRWPGSPPILAVRKDAARQVVLEAERSSLADRPLALRLSELALELDPASHDARRLQSSLALASPPNLPAQPATSTATLPNSARPRSPKPVGKAVRGSAPPPASAKPSEQNAPTEPAERPEPSQPTGGRWL